MYYSAAVRRTMERRLNKEQMGIPVLSIFVDHEYSQNGDPEREGSRKLRYHVYLITSDVQVKDVIAFACGNSLTSVATIGADKISAKMM